MMISKVWWPLRFEPGALHFETKLLKQNDPLQILFTFLCEIRLFDLESVFSTHESQFLYKAL